VVKQILARRDCLFDVRQELKFERRQDGLWESYVERRRAGQVTSWHSSRCPCHSLHMAASVHFKPLQKDLFHYLWGVLFCFSICKGGVCSGKYTQRHLDNELTLHDVVMVRVRATLPVRGRRERSRPDVALQPQLLQPGEFSLRGGLSLSGRAASRFAATTGLVLQAKPNAHQLLYRCQQGQSEVHICQQGQSDSLSDEAAGH
jgi:hypothetical protein